MTFDEAMAILSESKNAREAKRKMEIGCKMGGMIPATKEAHRIAMECIKRCWDFDQLRAQVGQKIYFALFDTNFPDESEVTEYEIEDVSALGLVRICDDWSNPMNPEECLFWTREEAEEALRRMKEKWEKREQS